MALQGNLKYISPISGITYFVSIPLYRPDKNPVEEMLYWLLNQSNRKLEYVSKLKIS